MRKHQRTLSEYFERLDCPESRGEVVRLVLDIILASAIPGRSLIARIRPHSRRPTTAECSVEDNVLFLNVGLKLAARTFEAYCRRTLSRRIWTRTKRTTRPARDVVTREELHSNMT